MVGKTIGHYQIQAQLGAGGMGIVYKATDTRLQRPVALKFLPPHLSSDENAKERFMQEARAASALDHANICTIYEVGQADDGQLYIAMALYEGQTLKNILEDRRMEAAEAVLIAHQIAAGLSRAHEAGIVHRDIKPANIMVTHRGEVKILDFGVAKLSESADLTKVGSTIGTAAYMSPEQARGEKVDTRADIWSVGILLYEMLAGERPFAGTYEAAFVYAIMNEEPDPIEAPLPEGLADVVKTCIRKLPEDRFQSCTELAAALEPFLSPSGAKHAAAAVVSSVPQSAADATTSPVKIAALYSLAAVIVLGFVYAVVIGFGLPDWVFLAGVVLMIIGLPSLLFAAHSEKASDGNSWFTLRRAVWGGVISMSSLSLVTAGFMVMRILGIGPAATLQSSGILEENAKLLVAEFDNQTQDETLGSSVTELLKIDLSQSAAISLMDGSDIVGVLGRMNRPTDSRIDLDTAMEIAAREGAEAVIAGDIRQIGAGFSISARLLAAADGTELDAFRVTAEDNTKIISAIDRLSGAVREQIGESIKTIRANEDLDRVTTSSLDALRLYSQGVVASDAGEFDRSIELLNQAVELDSTFAMSYRKLAVVLNNAGRPRELRIAAATKAYDLRDRLPERERWLAEAYYYDLVDGDRVKKVSAYENLLEKYPDDTAALNNVSIDYNLMGEFEKAERMLRHAIELGDRYVYYTNILNALSSQKKWDDVDAYIARFEQTNPDHPAQATYRFLSAVSRGDFLQADTLIRAASYNNSPYWHAIDVGHRIDFNIFRGKLAEQETLTNLSIALERDMGTPEVGLQWKLDAALDRLLFTGDAVLARSIMKNALAEIPLESLSIVSRPYETLVVLHAKLGDVEEAKRLNAEYESLLPENYRKGSLFRFQTAAEMLLAEGRVEEALATMQQSQEVDRCYRCFYYEQAMALDQLGRTEEALQKLEEFDDFPNMGAFWYFAPTKALTKFKLGELYSRLGNLDKAMEAYTQFVEIWKDADAVLQPQVQYARDEIDRLIELKLREPG